MSLILIGFTHAGKTTLGQLAAKKWGFKFVDTDQLIEQRTKMGVRESYQLLGEKAFREMEKEVCQTLLLSSEKRVIALGGGAPVDLLKGEGKVVYLHSTPSSILQRIQIYPLFAPSQEALVQSMGKRAPYYQLMADYTLQSESRNLIEQLEEVFFGE